MAIPQYREAIKLNSSDAVAHANLACALAEQEDARRRSWNIRRRSD